MAGEPPYASPRPPADRTAVVASKALLRRSTRERHDELLRLLSEGTTKVDDLASALSVSVSTVRRDLGRLAKDHRLARTYGGAVLATPFQEPVQSSPPLRRRATSIAERALELLPDTGAIFIDAGAMCMALAQRLADTCSEQVLLVTRDLHTAALLADSLRTEVVILGGTVRPATHDLVGPATDLTLEKLSFSAAFLGADSVDPSRGVGSATLEEAILKERVVSRADRTVVLAESPKLMVDYAPAWTQMPDSWTLVTDVEARIELEELCAGSGATLLRAAETPPCLPGVHGDEPPGHRMPIGD
jgi:DeoR/GlpR family transcriptional regulator of sugar metabolism